MPILHNQQLGKAKGTIVSLGYKDIRFNSMIEPFNVLVVNYNPERNKILDDKLKELEAKMNEEETEENDPTRIEDFEGDVVVFEFNNLDSLDTLIGQLNVVRNLMICQQQLQVLDKIRAKNKEKGEADIQKITGKASDK
jgi:hypothetical protein